MRSPTHRTVWPVIACDRASKSNMFFRYPKSPSAIAIGRIEKAPHIGPDRVFQRREAAIVAGMPQPIGLALGEILIAAPDLFGHVDVLDVRPSAERDIGRQHQIPKAARGAGADVEQPTDLRRRQ